jgi:anti-anti-sigma factor
MTTSKTQPLRLVESSPRTDEHAAEISRPLDITVQSGTDIHGVALVLLAGDIDGSSAPRLHAVIEKLMSERRRYLLVDLDDVTSRDATAYEGLVAATCSAVEGDATVLFTSDPRCVLMFKVEGESP